MNVAPRLWLLFSAASVLVAVPAFASEASATAEDVWRWTWPLYIVAPLVIAAFLYVVGLIRMRREKGHIRVSSGSVVCFFFGWLSLVLALDSPVHEWSEQLFWVHMTQHEILVLISAPLIVFAKPGVVWLWSFPNSWRTGIGHVLTEKP